MLATFSTEACIVARPVVPSLPAISRCCLAPAVCRWPPIDYLASILSPRSPQLSSLPSLSVATPCIAMLDSDSHMGRNRSTLAALFPISMKRGLPMYALIRTAACSAILVCGAIGFFNRRLPGRSVGAEEKATVLGSACYTVAAVNQWMCYGGGNGGSDCSGCGCTSSTPLYQSSTGTYNSLLANCNSDPHCTTSFASGNCGT